MTRHIQISAREYINIEEGGGFLGNVGGIFLKFTGFELALNQIIGHKCWKCIECGRATTRNLKGEIA